MRAIPENCPSHVFAAFTTLTLHVKVHALDCRTRLFVLMLMCLSILIQYVLIGSLIVLKGLMNLTKSGVTTNLESMNVFSSGTVFQTTTNRWVSVVHQAAFARGVDYTPSAC